jgi:hypothetical protein
MADIVAVVSRVEDVAKDEKCIECGRATLYLGAYLVLVRNKGYLNPALACKSCAEVSEDNDDGM